MFSFMKRRSEQGDGSGDFPDERIQGQGEKSSSSVQEAESKDVDSWSEAYAEKGWPHLPEGPDFPCDLDEDEWYRTAGASEAPILGEEHEPGECITELLSEQPSLACRPTWPWILSLVRGNLRLFLLRSRGAACALLSSPGKRDQWLPCLIQRHQVAWRHTFLQPSRA